MSSLRTWPFLTRMQERKARRARAAQQRSMFVDHYRWHCRNGTLKERYLDAHGVGFAMDMHRQFGIHKGKWNAGPNAHDVDDYEAHLQTTTDTGPR